MAEVLSPVIQQAVPVSMLHTSPDAFQNAPSGNTHQPSRASQMPRAHGYNGQNGGVGYRGTSSTPVAPYAFQSTPQLRQENRAVTAPVRTYASVTLQGHLNATRQGHPSHPSSSSNSTASTASSNRSVPNHHVQAKDDPALLAAQQNNKGADAKPISSTGQQAPTIDFSSSLPDLSLSLGGFDPAKPSPDRYRRGPQRADSSNSTITPQQPQAAARSAAPSGSGMANVAHLYKPNDRPQHGRSGSVDDMQVPKQGASQQAKRYRRRSIGGFDGEGLAANATNAAPAPAVGKQSESRAAAPLQPPPHERTNSGDSMSSGASANRPGSRQSSRPSSSVRRTLTRNCRTR